MPSWTGTSTTTGVTDPVSMFYNKFHRYPGNNKQWWVARADTDNTDTGEKAGDFLPEQLDKLFSGNNRAPRGHYILNAFNKDRSSVSGVSGIPTEVVDERPGTVAFYAGRAWFACNSTVYFSQLLTERYRAGMCYQEADPTSEDISDLIATDGGVIPIPEASKILKLLPNGSGVMVFASNGIWNVTGSNGGFSALDISVNKVSPIGCKCPMSIVETEDSVYWWSDVGIMGMQEKTGMYGPIPGAFDRNNISEQTIQSFYNDIPEESKREAKGIFDAKNNRIMWLYNDGDMDTTQYNSVLIFDLSLAAFYPWKFSSSTEFPTLKGLFLGERINITDEIETITVDGETLVADSEVVQTTNQRVNNYPTNVEYVAARTGRLHFCQVRNTNFADWETFDGTGLSYNSYVETGYELFNDAMRKKNITYVYTYLRRTENEWSTVDGEPELDDPSSCMLTVKWDWANSPVGNKWTTPVQVYRPGRFIPMSGSGVYDTGFPIVVTKSKVRGNGKALQFRYGTDELGRNFDLHGWSIAVTGNTTP
jgi:hypothetical protein